MHNGNTLFLMHNCYCDRLFTIVILRVQSLFHYKINSSIQVNKLCFLQSRISYISGCLKSTTPYFSYKLLLMCEASENCSVKLPL